jgi:hypothetical protein
MITEFTVNSVEGKIESANALAKQRFPKINVNLEDVTAQTDRLSVKYSFIADYLDSDASSAKSIGQLKLTGVVELKETKENVTSIMKRWTEQHTLPTQLAEEIMNGLNFRCSATGTLVAYSLGLIPPLGISTIKIQEQDKK